MATAAEYTFMTAVTKAEGVRQTAKAAALVTYGFVAANLAAYITALQAADDAFTASVKAALNTAAANNTVTFGNIGYGVTGPITSSMTTTFGNVA